MSVCFLPVNRQTTTLISPSSTASLRWASPELSFEEGDQLTVLGPAADDPDAAFEGESSDGAKGTFPKVRRRLTFWIRGRMASWSAKGRQPYVGQPVV